MPKIIIDMGLLDHLLIKSPGKFNVVADMSLQYGEKSEILCRICENFQQFFHQFHKIIEKAPDGTIDGYMLSKLRNVPILLVYVIIGPFWEILRKFESNFFYFGKNLKKKKKLEFFEIFYICLVV